MRANAPRTGEGVAVVRIAGSSGGVWRRNGFSGRLEGLSAEEVLARVSGSEWLDRDMLIAAINGFEAGMLAAAAKPADKEKEKNY